MIKVFILSLKNCIQNQEGKPCPKKKKNKKCSYFEELGVFSGRLQASPGALKSFMETEEENVRLRGYYKPTSFDSRADAVMHGSTIRVADPDPQCYVKLDPDPHRSQNSGAVKIETRRAMDAHNGGLVQNGAVNQLSVVTTRIFELCKKKVNYLLHKNHTKNGLNLVRKSGRYLGLLMIFSQLCFVDGEGLLFVPQRRSDMKLQVKSAYKRSRDKYRTVI